MIARPAAKAAGTLRGATQVRLSDMTLVFNMPSTLSIAGMATVTIRQLDETVKERLRVSAAQAGRSMEEEAREFLGNAVRKKLLSGPELFALSRKLFSGSRGVYLDLPPRTA